MLIFSISLAATAPISFCRRIINTKRSKYLLILSVTILIFIGVELLLPQPQYQHVYQDNDFIDYMSKSFEQKPSKLIYKSDALLFLYKNDNQYEDMNETKDDIEKTTTDE